MIGNALHRPAILLAASMLLAMTACSPAEEERTVGRDPVTIAVIPYLTLAPIYIAQAEGFFEQQGLDVEFVRLARNQELMTALARGDIDASVGMLTVNELALALTGARVRMIAAMGEFDPAGCTFGAVMARREVAESGALDDPEAMRGLVLDTTAFLPFNYWIDDVVAPLGLTTDDFETVDLPSTASVPAMIQGNIDLTIETEPFLTQLLTSGQAVVWKPVEQIVPGYVLSMLMFGPSLLDDRPEVGERFAVAVLQGIRQFARGKTPRNLAIVQEELGLDTVASAALCWPPMRADARIDPSIFDGYQAWSVEHGLIDRVLAPDELFDHRFIDYANAELGR